MKQGRLSKAEQQFVRDNVATMSIDQLSNRMDRQAESLRLWIEKNIPKPSVDPKVVIKTTLRDTVAWRHLQEEFTVDELLYFEERYVALKDQFNDDVKASEEGQLFKAIKSEIMMHRNLVQQKKTTEAVDKAEKLIQAKTTLRNKEKDPTAKSMLSAEILAMDTELQVIQAQLPTLTKQYDQLDRGHQEIMKSLKATREQRIAKITSRERSVLDIVRTLAEQEAQGRADRQIDQMYKATRKEAKRLGSIHKYQNGEYDRPLLSAETVEMEDE